MTPPDLTTPRLDLSALSLDDAADLWPVLADPVAMRWWHEPPAPDVESARASIASRISRRGAFWWAIRGRGAAGAIGFVGFLGETAFLGLGWLVRREDWGRGLATEAARAALGHGFGVRGLERVEMWVHEANLASRRVAEKLGARERGRFGQVYPADGRRAATIVYGLEARPDAAPARDALDVDPVLAVADVGRALAFYVERLGFSVEMRFGDPLAHAIVARGEWSCAAARVQFSGGGAPGPRPGALYFRSGDVDALAAEFRERGASFEGPRNEPWGMREIKVRDPDGHLLRFGTPC